MPNTPNNEMRKKWLRLASATLLTMGLLAVQAGFVLAEATPAPSGGTTTPPAQGQPGSKLSTSAPVGLPTPLAGISLQQLAGRIVNYMLGIAGAIGLLMFVYGGVVWMTAAGNQEKITEAKKTVVWSVMGLVMLFGSYVVVKFIIDAITAAQKK
jgi:hypothetical protein